MAIFADITTLLALTAGAGAGIGCELFELNATRKLIVAGYASSLVAEHYIAFEFGGEFHAVGIGFIAGCLFIPLMNALTRTPPVVPHKNHLRSHNGRAPRGGGL